MQVKQLITICKSIEEVNQTIGTLDTVTVPHGYCASQYLTIRAQLIAEVDALRLSLLA